MGSVLTPKAYGRNVFVSGCYVPWCRRAAGGLRRRYGEFEHLELLKTFAEANASENAFSGLTLAAPVVLRVPAAHRKDAHARSLANNEIGSLLVNRHIDAAP